MPVDSGWPRLTEARQPLTCQISVSDESGGLRPLAIPVERALTIYVDKRELITLMTLGARPEWLVLGYLRNQGLMKDLGQIESVTVDWDVGAAAVRTRCGIENLEALTAHRVITTGCGQGSLFGGLMEQVAGLRLATSAQISREQLFSLVDTIRLTDSTYKSAGSVHACALFSLGQPRPELLLFIEDVGRHNAVDTIAGWSWLRQAELPGPMALYTTGRLTSEMLIKAAQMGVPFVISRSGITQMGYQVAESVGLCAIGRALNRRYLCFTHPQRLLLD